VVKELVMDTPQGICGGYLQYIASAGKSSNTDVLPVEVQDWHFPVMLMRKQSNFWYFS